MPAAEAVPFRAPDSLAVRLELPNCGEVRGLAIRRGVTLVVGGGFHGKSTLLKAVEAGVYNKASRRRVVWQEEEEGVYSRLEKGGGAAAL